MPSYTTSLRLIQPSTGEYPGTWGTQVNTGLTALVDTSVAGTATITMTAADYTLSTANGATDEARAMVLNLTGTPGAARNVICPAVSKVYIVYNNTTGGFAQTLKTSAGTGISVPNGKTAFLRCDGTNVVEAVNYATSLSLGTALPATSGGTGLTSYTSGGVLYASSSSALATGSGLVFDGTNFATTGTASATKLIPTGGTATGNGMYLPAANTLAWSTAGVEGMRLDSSGNLLIGTATNTNNRRLLVNGTGSGSTYLAVGDLSQTANQTLLGIDPASTISYVGATSWGLGFLTNGTERMRLDASGNLGLGVTPSAWGGNYKAIQNLAGAFTNYSTSTVQVVQNGYDSAIGAWTYSSTAAATRYDQAAGEHRFFNAPSGTAGNAISFTQAMTLDASGNLGLGVTPGTWAAAAKAIEFTYPTYGQDSAGSAFMSFNARESSAGNWVYKTTDEASRFVANTDGSFRFFNAPSGTAGNAISFTQAMTLNASGNLGIGTSSPAQRLDVSGAQNSVQARFGNVAGRGLEISTALISGTNDAGSVLNAKGATSGTLIFQTDSTERMRLDASGNLLVGTTTAFPGSTGGNINGAMIESEGTGFFSRSGGFDALFVNRGNDGTVVTISRAAVAVGSISVSGSSTAYNTSSDYRLKDNQQPLTDSGAFIDALKPKTWNWKADGSKGVGFIAHEAQAVSPASVIGEKDAVDADGKPVMQAMEYGSAEFIANIVAELQSLRARVAQLESKA